MERKYIIVEDEFGNECAILFPPTLVHREVGRRHHVVAAGFYRTRDHSAHAYGRSESMNIESRGEVDAALIEELV